MSQQGMTLTVLVTQLMQAYAADTASGGKSCDIAAGLIGPVWFMGDTLLWIADDRRAQRNARTARGTP